MVWVVLILNLGHAIAQTAPIQFRPVSVEPAVEVGGEPWLIPGQAVWLALNGIPWIWTATGSGSVLYSIGLTRV